MSEAMKQAGVDIEPYNGNSTWTLPNQVGWPKAKELLFTARIVEALAERGIAKH